MDDREVIDRLYQLWAKTTGAEKRFWDYLTLHDRDHDIRSVGDDGESVVIGCFDSEADADFVTAIHGAMPTLARLYNEALDDAERVDRDRDERECRIAELELEVAALKKELLKP